MNVAIGISGLILIAAITPGPNNLMVLQLAGAVYLGALGLPLVYRSFGVPETQSESAPVAPLGAPALFVLQFAYAKAWVLVLTVSAAARALRSGDGRAADRLRRLAGTRWYPKMQIHYYSPAQQVMHWLTVLLMFSILPVAWIVDSVIEESPAFFFWMDVHETIGLTILGLTFVRIVWRLFDPPPPYPNTIAPASRRTARLVHGGLLILMIVMPISGFIWATGHGHDVAPFSLVRFPRIAFGHRSIGDAAEAVHLFCRWLVYGLIALHLAGVSYHLIIKRDGLLERMMPSQTLKTEEQES